MAAALDTLTELGVHRTTHRAIAERAQVPLGSLTYYFSSLTQILEEAFGLLVRQAAEHYRLSLARSRTRQEACEVVTDRICGSSSYAGEIVALFEMYSYSNHNTAVRALVLEWMLASRQSLSAFFGPATCRALDALVEGWPMHRHFEGDLPDRAVVLTAVTAVATAVEELDPHHDHTRSTHPHL